MIKISCNGCSNHCCGQISCLTPVLIPQEEQKFKDYSTRLETPFRTLHLLAKNPSGNCCFLDEKSKHCKIYEERPLECRLYPLLLDFSSGRAEIRIDGRYCRHLDMLEFDEAEISGALGSINLPKDWVKAYQSLGESC